MKRKIFLIIPLFFLIHQNYEVNGQFTSGEIAQREELEEYLRTAEIINQEQITGRKAVTKPWKLTLKKNGITRNAYWKNPMGRLKGYLEGWKWEIAAYRLDKYLELNMIPPTVEKRFRGDRGSCQLEVEYEMSLREITEKKIKIPLRKIFHWNRAIYLHRAFDNLIANQDRHAGNILVTKDWRMILIDHSRSFRTSKKFTKNLIYHEKHKEGPKIMRELPRAFVDKIKALNIKLIKDIVGDYLTDKEIKAVLIRRDLIVKEINRLIKKYGKEKVLY